MAGVVGTGNVPQSEIDAVLSAADIVGQYPTITEDGVRAAAAYGAWLAKQEVHGLPAGS